MSCVKVGGVSNFVQQKHKALADHYERLSVVSKLFHNHMVKQVVIANGFWLKTKQIWLKS